MMQFSQVTNHPVTLAEMESKLTASLELALTSLSQVSISGNNEERISASKELVRAVEMASEQIRKHALASKVVPLLSQLSANLSGQLEPGSPYAPAYSLSPAEQATILLSLSKELK